MALADSMFLFEIDIKNLKSYTRCKKFQIIGQFADVFKEYVSPTTMPFSKKTRTRNVRDKVKKSNHKLKKPESKIKTYASPSILIINKSTKLVSLMKKYPLEIIICKDNDSEQYLGSTIIPWNYEYLSYLTKKSVFPPACTEREYKVYDELTRKRIVTFKMSLKLTHIRSISKKPGTIMNSKKYKTKNHESLINASAKSIISISRKEMFPSVNCNAISHKPILLKLESFKKLKYKAPNIGCSKSDLNMAIKRKNTLDFVKSCSSIDDKHRYNLFRYIFGDPMGCFGNKVYQVGYFTVETDVSGQSSPKVVSGDQSPEKSTESKKKLTFKKCDSECLSKGFGSCSDNALTLDIPEDAADLISVTKCKEVTCNYKKHRELPPPPDDRILLDVTSLKNDCCTKVTEKVEEVVGGVITNIKIGHDPCYCTCECGMFSFTKTTYCTICGGYEIAGDDGTGRTALEAPMPCPIFHKLVDKNKLKTWSTSGSESKKKGDDQRSIRSSQSRRPTVSEKKSIESEKGKKKKKDDRFKFNYGYKGIPPQIGHSKCAFPCTGTLDNVPKRMGWLWSAENVPGLKFRPMWKPGAINKHVLRLLRMARHPGQIISKKKRKDLGKKKRPLKRPLLVVHKKDGEYTVTMETMKTFLKPRALNQNPYEDKPVVTFTVGRTEEENRERLKRKEREQRRLERAQRNFIQSAFRDMCHEICLKTYQQALGILPDAEDPLCTCYPLPSAKHTNLDLSCSCSEDKSSAVGSDTDSDEWMVEFTPPNATFDPFYKGKKVVKEDNGSQYTYLDYRVKLVDRFGNGIPRFFKGPNGKQECSDLGGFWGPDHKWLEINIDGYIAPDGKWAPMNFIGPSGEQVEAYTGKFQTMNGKWLVVGVDGFVDSQGKWKYYPKALESMKKRHGGASGKKGKTSDKILERTALQSQGSWSCFGDVSPRHLSELGIVGHGVDRKLLLIKLQQMLERGEDIRIPQPSTVYRLPPSKSARKGGSRMKLSRSLQERYKCRHPVPSDKGIVAVNDHGHKTYFRLKDHKNRRPNERIAVLTEQGISLSSFHVPCFHSFINSEVMKQQQRERIFTLSNKNVATQIS